MSRTESTCSVNDCQPPRRQTNFNAKRDDQNENEKIQQTESIAKNRLDDGHSLPYGHHPGIRIGWANDGAIRNCSFSNIVMHDTVRGIGIILPSIGNITDYGREATLVENITFSDVIMDGIYKRPIEISISSERNGTKAAAIRDIRFSGVRATGAMFPYLAGRPGCPIRNVSFTGCSFRQTSDPSYPNFTHRSMAKHEMEKDGRLVIQHAEGLRLNDTAFDTP